MKLTAVKKLPVDKKWFSLIPILLIGVLIITVNLLSTFSVTEYRIASHLKKLTTAQDYTDKLVVIEYKPKVITRIEIAGLIQTLAYANARSILLDLNLSKASLVEIDDYILSQTLKANKKIKVILPIYTNGDQALEPLPSFSKHTALGYVDLQSDVNHQSMPIQLRSNTAASEYPHAVLLQLGNQRSDNLSTLIEPSINAASIYRLSFSETIKNSNNKRFAHKDILIGPNTKRTTIHALLYKTLMHGEVKAVPQYINFAIFLILSLFLVNLFAKNDDRMHIIFISSCIAILPLISSLASIVFLRALIPAFSLTTGIILVILYLSYFHKAKLLSNYTNRIDLSEHDNGLFEGELLIGKNGDISIADPIVTLLLGYKNRNLNGTPIHIIIPSLNQEKWADFYNKLHKTEAPDEHIYDFIAKKPNGKEMKIQLQPKCFTGANTSFIQFIFRDICKYSNKNYVALEYLAKYDEVSKTLNKLGIMEYLSNEINISNNASFISVMILHIENFSVISNSLGKKACDLILRSFASRIIKCIGKETAIGRIDTADFLLITNDVNNSNKLQNRIHKVIKVAKNAIHTSGISVELSLRVGLANYPEHGESADELIMNARLALAIAKQKTLALYNKYVNKNNTKSSIKVIEIHKAIKENQFKVHYQPIINLKDYSVSSVEALLR